MYLLLLVLGPLVVTVFASQPSGLFFSLLLFPRESPGVKSGMCPPYPQRDRKRRLSKREVPRGVRNSKVRRQDKLRKDWSRH